MKQITIVATGHSVLLIHLAAFLSFRVEYLIAAHTYEKVLTVHGKQVKIKIIVVSDEQQHEDQRKHHYTLADLIMLGYNTSNIQSFYNCYLNLFSEKKKLKPNVPVVLLGCVMEGQTSEVSRKKGATMSKLMEAIMFSIVCEKEAQKTLERILEEVAAMMLPTKGGIVSKVLNHSKSCPSFATKEWKLDEITPQDVSNLLKETLESLKWSSNLLNNNAVRIENQPYASNDNNAPIPETELPTGWQSFWDSESKKYYYHHPETNTTQWEPPKDSTTLQESNHPQNYEDKSNQNGNTVVTLQLLHDDTSFVVPFDGSSLDRLKSIVCATAGLNNLNFHIEYKNQHLGVFARLTTADLPNLTDKMCIRIRPAK